MRGVLLFFSGVSLCNAAGHNPTEVLALLRDRVIQSVDRLPNYTCVETVSRTFFLPNSARMPQSCDEHEGRKRQGIYQMVAVSADRLRLDVAAVSQREIFSWAGAQKFEDGELWEMGRGGGLGPRRLRRFPEGYFRRRYRLVHFRSRNQCRRARPDGVHLRNPGGIQSL